MELVKKMFRWSIPIIGFPMVREGTGNEELLSNTIFGFEQSTYIRVKIWTKKDVETIAIRMKKTKTTIGK